MSIMKNYIDDVIVTLKLKMSSYNKQSEIYKEMLYAVEMLECAKKLQKEEANKISHRIRKLGIRKNIRK